MSFAEHRTALAAELARLESLARQAQEASRGLVERADAAADATETLADDAALARVRGVARRARQELATLTRELRAVSDEWRMMSDG